MNDTEMDLYLPPKVTILESGSLEESLDFKKVGFLFGGVTKSSYTVGYPNVFENGCPDCVDSPTHLCVECKEEGYGEDTYLAIGPDGQEHLYSDLNIGEFYYTYFNKDKNILIIGGMEEYDDVTAIFDGTMGDAFQFISSLFTGNGNKVLVWFKCEGTTSDFTVFHDMDASAYVSKDPHQAHSDLLKLVKVPYSGYKYTEVRNGVELPYL